MDVQPIATDRGGERDRPRRQAMSSLLGPTVAEVSGSIRLTCIRGAALLPRAGLAERGAQAPAARRVAMTTALSGASAQAISK